MMRVTELGALVCPPDTSPRIVGGKKTCISKGDHRAGTQLAQEEASARATQEALFAQQQAYQERASRELRSFLGIRYKWWALGLGLAVGGAFAVKAIKSR